MRDASALRPARLKETVTVSSRRSSRKYSTSSRRTTGPMRSRSNSRTVKPFSWKNSMRVSADMSRYAVLRMWELKSISAQRTSNVRVNGPCARLLLCCVIQPPVVLEKPESCLPVLDELAVPGLVGEERGVAREVLRARAGRRRLAIQSAVAAGPVFLEPVEYFRHFERAARRVVAVAGAVGKEAHCLLLELCVEALGDIGLLAQHGAADGSAVDGEVRARLVVGAGPAQR